MMETPQPPARAKAAAADDAEAAAAWDAFKAGEEKRPESLASANAATKTTATAPPQRPKDTKRELQEDATAWMMETPQPPARAKAAAADDAEAAAAWDAFKAGEEKRPESLASANAATKTTATAPPQRPKDTKRELQVPTEPVHSDEAVSRIKADQAAEKVGVMYADMEVCSTASDEGMDFYWDDSSEEESFEAARFKVDPPNRAKAEAKAKPAAGRAKAKAAPKADRKRKAQQLTETSLPAVPAAGRTTPASTSLGVGGIAVGDVVKILKPRQGKDKLEGTLATVSCEMPPSSLQLTLADGQQVLRKRSEIQLVDNSNQASAVAEKLPKKSGLLRQLKTAEADREQVLRGRKLERESVSSRQPNRGKGKGGKGKTKSSTPLGSSSFEEFGKVLDVEAKVRGSWGCSSHFLCQSLMMRCGHKALCIFVRQRESFWMVLGDKWKFDVVGILGTQSQSCKFELVERWN
eukprot:Skav214136  [mRNA]  locus=scaffold1185:752300:755488:- [translate_table: standard]